jgi:hypothetical protein
MYHFHSLAQQHTVHLVRLHIQCKRSLYINHPPGHHSLLI